VPDVRITLDQREEDCLLQDRISSMSSGGFQQLLVSLIINYNRDTHVLCVTERQQERIKRYAFNYRNGGWQGRLATIFARHAGPELDKWSDKT